jgi:hypothetical protein
VIDYVDVVFVDDDEILILIVIVIVYVDDVLPMMIEIDHVVFDDVISHHYFPKNKKSNTSCIISQSLKFYLKYIPTIKQKKVSLKLTIY